MRLIAHNMLRSNVKGVEKGYPLQMVVDCSEVVEMEFDGDFIQSLLKTKGRIDWNGFIVGCQALGILDDPEHCLPVEGWNEDMLEDDDFLRRVHHALLEVHVLEGKLVCPESGREFPVVEGIPNMLLNDDEMR